MLGFRKTYTTIFINMNKNAISHSRSDIDLHWGWKTDLKKIEGIFISSVSHNCGFVVVQLKYTRGNNLIGTFTLNKVKFNNKEGKMSAPRVSFQAEGLNLLEADLCSDWPHCPTFPTILWQTDGLPRINSLHTTSIDPQPVP